MLTHPTLDLLHCLGLHGMAKGFKDLDAQSEARSLEHAEWLALLLEHEKTLRQQKRFESRARAAKLRHAACVEDVDYRAIRGLDRALFLKLAAGDWIRARHNLLVTGPTGVGKSWLACALGNKACRDDFSVAYHRVPRLFAALALGRADGRYTRMLRAIARLDLLILDDWGPEPLDADQRRDLLEIVEDRYEARSIIVTSQLPVDRWYEIIGNPTIADAILDRLVHNAYRFELKGESLRKQKQSAQDNRSLDLPSPRRHHEIDPCERRHGWPASDRNTRPASNWNAWPASSESARTLRSTSSTTASPFGRRPRSVCG